MTPEEARRRQQLIDNLIANGSLDLAADVAKGPYRINQGSPGSSQPPGTQYPQNSADIMKSPSINSAQPMGAAWNPANQPSGGVPPGGTTPPTPTGNPKYDYPTPSMSDQVRSGGGSPAAQPTINIHVTGTTPSTYEGYPTPQSAGVPTSYPPGTGLDGYMPPEWQAQVDQYEDVQWGAWPGHQQQMDQKEHFMNQRMAQINGPSQPVGMPSFAPPPQYNSRQPFPPQTPPFNNSLSGYPGGATTWTPPYGGSPQAPQAPGLTSADFGPAQPMFNLGIRRPVPMAQIQAPFTDTGWGNLSR
jgi:hypothetical protein